MKKWNVSIKVVLLALLAVTVALPLVPLAMVPAAGGAAQVETVSVPVLAKDLKKGEIITADTLTRKQVPLRYVSGHVVKTEEEMLGKQAVRAISKGRMVPTNGIRLMPLVERSGNVLMVYKTNSIELQATGIAMQDGMAGDLVKVMNSSSRQVVMAHVVAPNKVEVK